MPQYVCLKQDAAILRRAINTTRGLKQETDLDVLEAVDTSDTVTDAQDATGLLEVGLGGSAEDSLLKDGGDLGGGRGAIASRRGGQLLGQHADGGSLLSDLQYWLRMLRSSNDTRSLLKPSS